MFVIFCIVLTVNECCMPSKSKHHFHYNVYKCVVLAQLADLCSADWATGNSIAGQKLSICVSVSVFTSLYMAIWTFLPCWMFPGHSLWTNSVPKIHWNKLPWCILQTFAFPSQNISADSSRVFPSLIFPKTILPPWMPVEHHSHAFYCCTLSVWLVDSDTQFCRHLKTCLFKPTFDCLHWDCCYAPLFL